MQFNTSIDLTVNVRKNIHGEILKMVLIDNTVFYANDDFLEATKSDLENESSGNHELNDCDLDIIVEYDYQFAEPSNNVLEAAVITSVKLWNQELSIDSNQYEIIQNKALKHYQES